ncbi:hypothetical protein AAHH17_12455 [Lysinibacillus capsici]|uniref:hypothetical protein n=1 Tax=Lysinibacillus capsici TaxID=2115968 RepID=UPI0032E4B29E
MDFDLQISQKRDEKQKLIDEMEIKKEEFLVALKEFTSNWFEEETLSTIKGNSEKVFELGDDKARELKEKIKVLIESSSDIVRKHLDLNQIWWHKNEDNDSYYYGRNRLLDKHDNNIKIMFGELGNIFIEYGILRASSEYDIAKADFSGWIYEGFAQNRILKYAYGISYPKKLSDVYGEYIDLIVKGQELNKQISILEENKKRENIEDWWKTL